VVGLVLVDVGGRPEGSEARRPAAKRGQMVAESRPISTAFSLSRFHSLRAQASAEDGRGCPSSALVKPPVLPRSIISGVSLGSRLAAPWWQLELLALHFLEGFLLLGSQQSEGFLFRLLA